MKNSDKGEDRLTAGLTLHLLPGGTAVSLHWTSQPLSTTPVLELSGSGFWQAHSPLFPSDLAEAGWWCSDVTSSRVQHHLRDLSIFLANSAQTSIWGGLCSLPRRWIIELLKPHVPLPRLACFLHHGSQSIIAWVSSVGPFGPKKCVNNFISSSSK